MTDLTHFGAFVDHIMSDDDSELGKMKAERDYALHCLEREIAICTKTQACNDALVKALKNARNCIDTLIVNSPDKKKRRNLGEFILEIDNALAMIKGRA